MHLLTTTLTSLIISLTQAQAQQHPLQTTSPPTSPFNLTMRPATFTDVDSIVDIVLTAFPLDPQFTYQYRWRLQYPEEHWNCTRDAFYEFFSHPEKMPDIEAWVVVSPDDRDEKVERAVAAAVYKRAGKGSWGEGNGDEDWLIFNTAALATGINCKNRHDVDRAREAAFSKTMSSYAREHFVAEFGDRHLHLGMIATHPDYQRRGAAGMMLRWGIDKAEREGLAISLFASPMGKPVYQHMGYEVRDVVRVQVEGEEEFITETAMAYVDSFYH